MTHRLVLTSLLSIEYYYYTVIPASHMHSLHFGAESQRRIMNRMACLKGHTHLATLV